MKVVHDKTVNRGWIAWMVNNHVTANLLMAFLIIGGLFMSGKIKKEVFPEFTLDVVRVSVAYPGSSPEEVEQGIILSIEEGVQGVDGIKELTATASEGAASVSAELMTDADHQKAYQDIKQQVDRITTFPLDAEEPVVTLVSRKRRVLNIQIFGDVSERVLRETVEQTRDRLLLNPDITQIDVLGGRDYEISVQIPMENMRAYGLTLSQVAGIIKNASMEIPGGKLETSGGEILLRVKDRKDWARQFGRIPIVTTPRGAVVYLEDIAAVKEGFEDTNRYATYNAKPSIGLSVYRMGKQTPITVSDAVRKAMAEIETDLPQGIDWEINRDRSDIYRQRLELLLKNAFIGLALVLCLLGVFLEFKLAFWVTMGIPTSFLGALLFLPSMDVSINIVSMFAFIVALGIVVDDAIVAGENIYEYRQKGMDFITAAVRGAKDIAVPVTFSILTNVVAFLPLYFVPGFMGKIWRAIPLVVITVFAISWVESLLILPAHLGHTKSRPSTRLTAVFHGWQQAFSLKVSQFIKIVYGPFLYICLRWRFLTLATAIAVLCMAVGYVASKRIGIILMPRVESNRSVVTATLPYGSPFSKVKTLQDQLVSAIESVAEENGGKTLLKGVFSLVDENSIEVSAYLTAPDIRPLTTRRVTQLWRNRVGQIPGIQTIRYESDRGGPGSGATLSIELSHRDINILDRAGAALGDALRDFPNVKDVDDGYTPGKEQLDFTVNTHGTSLGLSTSEVARQVRNAFHGTIALRQQRGRNEVTVRVRLPKSQRMNEYDVENMLISTPAGRYVPLNQVARVKRGRAYTAITRRDGRRTITVTANVDPIGETDKVMSALNKTMLPQLVSDHKGLDYGYEGRQADRKESIQNLFKGFGLAMVAIFFLLAIPFQSYAQPMIIMMAIPFGMVGALIGHIIMGYNLSLMSMMGVVALSGVVVNDSLVLINYANQQQKEGANALKAIHMAGIRRFRPIFLTTVTTFGGLAPMIFETSRQARFMIPMAISLGFGILFATVIALILVPCLYLMVENFRNMLKRVSASDTDLEIKKKSVQETAETRFR